MGADRRFPTADDDGGFGHRQALQEPQHDHTALGPGEGQEQVAELHQLGRSLRRRRVRWVALRCLTLAQDSVATVDHRAADIGSGVVDGAYPLSGGDEGIVHHLLGFGSSSE